MGVSGDFGGGGGGSFSAPSYSAPSYSAPVYEAPAYSAPAYEAPAQTPAQIEATLDFWQNGIQFDFMPQETSTGTSSGQAESASAEVTNFDYFPGYDFSNFGGDLGASYSEPATSNTGAFTELPSYTQMTGRDVPTNTSISNQSQFTGTPFGQAGSAGSTYPYTVQPGDTLSEIAANADIPLQQLIDLNPKFDESSASYNPKYDGGNTIFAGTKVNLPNPDYNPLPEPDIRGGNPAGSEGQPDKPVVEEPPTGQPQEITNYQPIDTYVPPVYVAPTPPAPTIEPVLTSPPPPAIKTAQPDIILFEDDLPSSQAMIDLVLEDIGGQELINIARSDTINGQNITYQPIKNLVTVQKQNNPNNIINLQQTSKQNFSNFTINLNDKIPDSGSYLGNNTNDYNFYINTNGDLVIQFINLLPDERIQVELFQTDYINDSV